MARKAIAYLFGAYVALIAGCDTHERDAGSGFPVIESFPCRIEPIQRALPDLPLGRVRFYSVRDDKNIDEGCWYLVGYERPVNQAAVVLVWPDGKKETYPLAAFTTYGFRLDPQKHEYAPAYERDQ